MESMSLAKEKPEIVTLGRVWHKPIRQGGLPPQAVLAPLSYVIVAQAQQTLYEHIYASPEVEVGGILLGEVLAAQENYLVCITDVLPAIHTISGSIYLTFTGETWLDLIARRAQFSDKKTVGWYHSHPGIGTFLSWSDIFIHRSFFGDQPWYIAMVVDPRSGEQEGFGWNGSQIAPCPALPMSEKIQKEDLL